MESRGYRLCTHRGVSVGQTQVLLITLIMGLLHEVEPGPGGRYTLHHSRPATSTVNSLHLYSPFIQSALQLPHIHPFIHTFIHLPR